MGFAFAETMSGTLELDKEPGIQRPLRFDIKIHAASTRDHIATGRAKVVGIVSAPPITNKTGIEGSILIRPLGQRVIRYELTFVGDDGKRYELVGQKDIKLRRLVQTWTTLPMEILDDQDRRVATCLTRFDYQKDGWSFLRSFRPA